jgi:site-specific DNA-methyltransferase (adenine-specific)
MPGGFCRHCDAWYGQLGLEPTIDLYIKHLCDIFDEVKRVLKNQGTCWVNLGDTYYTKSGSSFENDMLSKKNADEVRKTTGINTANLVRGRGLLPSKCLTQIPSRFALEMCNRGWILRNEIIWHKPNVMPSSVKDRFTVDFEKLFFFTKSKKYWFEPQYEQYSGPMNRWGGDQLKAKGKSTWDAGTGQGTYRERNMRPNPLGRNKRAVWRIPTKPYKEAHFATFPEALIETPIQAGCPKQGVVLDPFMGSGTVAVVSKKSGRNFIGVELNPDYIAIAQKRLQAMEKR